MSPETAGPAQGGDDAHGRVRRSSENTSTRIQVLSDLDFDAYPGTLPRLAEGAHAVVVAGDTCEGAEKGYAFLRAAFPPPTPILAVLGNCAFHGRSLLDELARARALAPDYGITLLEDATAIIRGVRFIGATMWSGFDLDGPEGQPAAMRSAAVGIADYRRISLMTEPSPVPFTPRHSLELHEASTAYIAMRLGEAWIGPTVVVTHHAPSLLSIPLPRRREPIAAASASRLERMVRGSGAAFWIHGHVEASCDYRLGRTRVVCNPRGRGPGNPHFDSELLVEVAR